MYKFNKVSILITSVLWGYLLPLYAQDASNTIGRVNIASPTAAALGKYGDIPVNYHTGIPNINIPVYTIKSGKIELPVSLSYHASGLKVQEQASWVGAGWSLNCGGMITRTVRGAADDRGNNNGYVTHGYYSDSGYYNYSFHPDGSVPPSAQTNGLGPDDGQFLASRKDGEPDLYTFNFGGYSGKFYFNDDQTPVLVPQADFKIQTDFSPGPGFLGFVITTSEGTKYYFGKTGNNGSIDPVEVTYSITTQNSYGLASKTTSSWFLNKIVSFDNTDSVLLNYQQENYSYYTIAMFPLFYPQGITGWGTYTHEYDLVKNYIQGVRLSSITYPNGTITFNAQSTPRTDLAGFADQTLTDAANTEAKALASIQIADNGTFCKKMNFYYSYFFDNQNGLTGDLFVFNYPILQNIQSDKYRLKLDSLQEVSCDNSIKIPPYKFSYFTELVPRKLSFGIDHWGFYNGVTTNTTLIPDHTLVTDNSFDKYTGANREASWPAMRGGSLNKITYPAGGYTLLDYEPHNTYTSFTKYMPTFRFSASPGYDGHNGTIGDGGSNPANYSMAFTSNPYTVTLSNTNNNIAGSIATVQIGGGGILNISANPGETKIADIRTTPGTYNIFVHKEYATAGFGASINITEQAPVLTSGNAMVGGLRIKTLTNNDGTADNVKSFTYNVANNASGNSSGILYSRPTYIQTIRNNILNLVWGGNAGGMINGCASVGPLHDYYKSPSSIRPMENTQGNHIGYNEVYVSQTNNGYSVYRYYGSNTWDNITEDVCKRQLVNKTLCDPAIPNYPEAPPAFEYKRGELKYEGHFNQAGQLIKDIYYYPEYTQDLNPVPGHIAFQCPAISSFTDYVLYTYKKISNKTVTTDYNIPSAGAAVSNTNIIYYGSKFHNQPTRNVVFTSSGDSIAANMKYAADFRITSCDAQPDSLTYYLNRIQNDSAFFFINIGSCTPQTGYPSYSNCRYIELIKLRYKLMISRQLYMNYLKRTYSNANSVFNTCHLNAKTAAGTELKPILEMQDTYQNPVIETSKWRNLNLLEAGFTRYDFSTTPANKVYPNKIQSISLAANAASFTNAAVSGTTITKDSRYKDEASFKFSAGNPVEQTPKSGITTCYLWDYKNTQPTAQVTGAVNSQVAYTSFEADGTGNLTYATAKTSDITSPTGGYCYSLVSGAVQRASLTSTTSYILSYWYKTGAAVTVTAGTQTNIVTGPVRNGWTYKQLQFTGSTTAGISGTGFIDEVRIYPLGAQMTTYTYSPLVGMMSACDANNKITLYEYNKLGMLKNIKDQNSNIKQNFIYNYGLLPGVL